MAAISISNLVKVYKSGTHALKGVTLEIGEGQFFALLGANGAGKTTIINILTGLVNKTSGAVTIYGYDIDREFAKAKKLIGVVPQEFNFNMFEKVQDIVAIQAGYFGIDWPTACRRSEEVLRQVGLWEKRNASARTLSGGMKRRLMIARALIHNPKLLILDEPTAGVDVELRYGMWEYLRTINKQGTTILLTTHYLEEVEQMCEYAAIIKEGEIMHCDRVRNLIGMLDEETFLIGLRDTRNLDGIREFGPVAVDDRTIEVHLKRKEQFNDLIKKLAGAGLVVTDISPKERRLEKLFLKMLKE